MARGKRSCSVDERTASISGRPRRRRRRLLQHATLPCEDLRITSAVVAKRPIISRMLIRKAPDLRFSDITPKSLYLRRREFLQTAAGAALGAAAAAVVSPLAATVAAQQK